MTPVLVTGANGFVGRRAVARLAADGRQVRAVVRALPAATDRAVDWRSVGDLADVADWQPLLAGVGAVIHLAGRAHKMNEWPAEEYLYRRVNVELTLRLARAAAEAGVRRFVFVSSVKASGESTAPEECLSSADQPAPVDPYGLSKFEAERGLRELSAATGLEVVIVRPPLVYGPGVGANFLRLMNAVDRGLPLPFGAVENRRSLVFVGNLVDALVVCAEHPQAAGRTYLVSDGEDVSTPELVRAIAGALGRAPRLIGVPPALMRAAGALLGRRAQVDRLLGSLAVDSGPIRSELGWMPPYSLRQGLAETAAWYRQRKAA